VFYFSLTLIIIICLTKKLQNESSYNGVRGVDFEMKTDIHHFINVRSVRAKVYYNGLKDKCFLCGSVEHQKRNCSTNKVVRTSVTPTTRLQKSRNNFVNLNSLFKTPYNNIGVLNKTDDTSEVNKIFPELPEVLA
jgi:hypothetical protein